LQVFSAILKTAREELRGFVMPALLMLAIFDPVGEADGASAGNADRESSA
jgi:hypothetical protein